MIDRIAYLFGQTAWPMEMQAPGSAFHLLLSLAGIACAVLAAMFLAGRKYKRLFRRQRGYRGDIS